jgi:hypothetical protein
MKLQSAKNKSGYTAWLKNEIENGNKEVLREYEEFAQQALKEQKEHEARKRYRDIDNFDFSKYYGRSVSIKGQSFTNLVRAYRKENTKIAAVFENGTVVFGNLRAFKEAFISKNKIGGETEKSIMNK